MMKSMSRVRIVADMQANLKAPRRRVGSSIIVRSSRASFSSSMTVGRFAFWFRCDSIFRRRADFFLSAGMPGGLCSRLEESGAGVPTSETALMPRVISQSKSLGLIYEMTTVRIRPVRTLAIFPASVG